MYQLVMVKDNGEIYRSAPMASDRIAQMVVAMKFCAGDDVTISVEEYFVGALK